MATMPGDPQGALDDLLVQCKGELTPHGSVIIPILNDIRLLQEILQALPGSPRPVVIVIRGSRFGLRIFDRHDASRDEYVILVKNAYTIADQPIYGMNGGCAWRAHDIIAAITGLSNEILRPVILRSAREVIVTYNETEESWKFFYRLRIYGPPFAH